MANIDGCQARNDIFYVSVFMLCNLLFVPLTATLCVSFLIFQDMKVDIAPLLSIRMESSIVIGVKELYMEYVVILEKAITDDKQVSEVGPVINVAESLPQKVSMLANLSSLQQLFFNILRSFCCSPEIMHQS